MNLLRNVFLGLLAILPLGPVLAQEPFYRDVYDPKTNSYVEVVSLFAKLPTQGYAPIRVTIANRTGNPARVSLNFESTTGSHYYGYSGKLSMDSSFSVGCEANSVNTVDLLVPVAPVVKESGYSSYPNSQTLEMTMLGSANGSYAQNANTGQDFPNILLSEKLHTLNASSLDAATSSHIASSSRYSSGSNSFAGKFTPNMMPDDWRAYAGFDHIIMTDSDWKELSPGARSGILQWNRLGGTLNIHAVDNNSTLASLGIDKNSNQPRLTQRSMGLVTIQPITASLVLNATNLVDEVSKSSSPTWQAKSMINDYAGSWGLQSDFGTKTFHFVMFILVLIAFGILVGPVNLFVFAKSGKRHKLFITTPIIAIGASVAMILLIFLQDGLGGKGMRAQLMEIHSSDGDNNAYVHQEQISRSGVLIGNRFEITEPCTFAAVPLSSTQWTRLTTDSNVDQSYSINKTDKGINVSGDWFQSRSEQAQILQSIIPTRSRIEQAPGGNAAALISSFDYEIEALCYAGPDGKFWRADHIAAGKNFLCREISESEYNNFVKTSGNLLGNGNKEKLDLLSKRKEHFVAISQAAPMIDTFRSISWKKNITVLTGAIRTPEQP